MRGESGISFTGLYIGGAISFVMLVLKLSVIVIPGRGGE